MLNRYNQLDISYDQLKTVLNSFGFEQRTTPSFTAFRETEHDALIILPLMDNYDLVSEPHLIVINNTIVGKRITSEEDLFRRFQEAATKSSLPLDTKSGKTTISSPEPNRSPKLREYRKTTAVNALSHVKPSSKTAYSTAAKATGKTLVEGRVAARASGKPNVGK